MWKNFPNLLNWMFVNFEFEREVSMFISLRKSPVPNIRESRSKLRFLTTILSNFIVLYVSLTGLRPCKNIKLSSESSYKFPSIFKY